MKPHFIAFLPPNALQQPLHLEERRRIEYDETFSETEIDLIEKLLSVSLEKGKINDQNNVIKALQ